MILPPESRPSSAQRLFMRLRAMLQVALALGLLGIGFGGWSAGAQPAAETDAALGAGERIAWLRAEIARHDELYFKKASPEISDAAYDELKREQRALQAAHPESAAALGGGVGDDRSGGFTIRAHRARMLSLEKSYTEAELRAFVEKVRRQLAPAEPSFVIEPKFDGLAISVTYEKGRLVRAVTRGNGVEGDDVTDNLLKLAELPRELAATSVPMPDLIELRGEVYMEWKEFNRINRERESAGSEPYAHPRNLAVGTLKQASESIATDRRLAVVFYGMGACEPESAQPGSQQRLLHRLRMWGLPTVESREVARTADDVWRAIKAIGAGRNQLAFPIDGAVVKVDDGEQQRRMGETDEAPRWAIAYKYPADRVATRLIGITWQIGRTGVLTPVAELAAVQLGGSMVRRASLHNRQEIARQDLRSGDWVWLEKVGEIIPAIVDVDRSRRLAGAEAYAVPEACPSCGRRLVFEDVAVRCPNYDCPAQVQRRLEYFVSDSAVDINGVGKALIATLVERKRVTHPADLYALRREDLAEVMSDKRVEKVLTAITASRSRERWRFVCGMGVPEVGPAAARAVARHFADLGAWARAGESDYAGSGVSETAKQAALRYFAEPARRAEVEQLQRVIERKE